ncbi:hypothetical protein D5366_06730 [Neokomagataea tanensis]|uniref:Glycosyltransferase RgtA/B/C/D-like domain-containing protein n=1 Tax=Neokomagataea tanensis TaxID=661191 RepID=A0A4Y6V4V1_9PROT|nr:MULTISPECIES: hypothetical protein [Neokomagataea]QDH24953.1 hypothetical protein D5366_06730 [Neokomagataea tanensis]
MFVARLALGLCLILAGAVIILHACILPYAMWQGDEYDYFYNFAHNGRNFFWHRLLFWSPRPLSESVIALYGAAITHFNVPLIGPALGVIWAACGALAFLPTLLTRNIPLNARLFFFALGGIIVFLGHPVADLMFWPMAAAAHLPVFAALLCLTLRTLTNSKSSWLTVLCLSVAATASEAGFFFTTSYLCVQMLAAVRARNILPPGLWIPALCCGFVAWRLLAGRISLPHPHSSPTQGMTLASIKASIVPFFHNLAVLQPIDTSAGGTDGGDIFHGIVLKIILALSSFAALRATALRPSIGALTTLSISLLACQALTIASAYYEFGFLCCQRHETLRLEISLLLALLVGGYAARCIPRFHFSTACLRGLACLGLLLFTLDTALWRLPNLVLFFQSRTAEAEARNTTWQSGMSTGSEMTMRQGTNSAIFYYWPWEPGQYTTGKASWDVEAMMRFFGKTRLVILPPLPVSITTRIH